MLKLKKKVSVVCCFTTTITFWKYITNEKQKLSPNKGQM